MLFQLFVAFLCLAIFVSGINRDTLLISIIVSFLATCLGLTHLLKSGRKIGFPKYFPLMLLFVLILQLYLFFVQDKLNPFYSVAVIGEGTVYWLIFFNLKNGSKILKSILIWFSLIYSLLYFLSKTFSINLTKLAELYFQEGLIPRHYHVGDLWAFTVVVLIGIGWDNPKFKTWLTIGLGCIFLALSNARSAFLSFALGLSYLLAKKTATSKFKKTITVSFIGLMAGLFIFSSFGKTTLFDRPYFTQSIESFTKYPLGIGMGNFEKIADLYRLKDSNASVSVYTHNIFLEALSGVGIFSTVFLIFLVYLIRDTLKENRESAVWGAVLIAILTNFMIDTSYAIPGLVWILFITVGVFQSKIKLLRSS